MDTWQLTNPEHYTPTTPYTSMDILNLRWLWTRIGQKDKKWIIFGQKIFSGQEWLILMDKLKSFGQKLDKNGNSREPQSSKLLPNDKSL